MTGVEHKKKQKMVNLLESYILRDYQASFSFYLFGDDYISFKSYLMDGWLLYISGTVKKKFYNDDLEFKINKIEILSELIDKEPRDIIFKIHINEINDDFVEFSSLIEKYPGKHHYF